MGDPNLPPGCSVSDLPGNRPGDEDWDRFWTRVDDNGLGSVDVAEVVLEGHPALGKLRELATDLVNDNADPVRDLALLPPFRGREVEARVGTRLLLQVGAGGCVRKRVPVEVVEVRRQTGLPSPDGRPCPRPRPLVEEFVLVFRVVEGGA